MELVDAEVRERVQASFERQGLMEHLGARISHITSVLTVEVKINLLPVCN